ncbi:hypothetical protein GCM10022232_93030 [Streptomyces plumbiresistens]|uniref:Uncharacterized protein n=2 Tax=Streptomyces TaxID=1883 RepID=A0ABP7TWX1_9ACTN
MHAKLLRAHAAATPDAVTHKHKAIDAARTQYSAINSGGDRLDHVASQHCTNQDATTRKAQDAQRSTIDLKDPGCATSDTHHRPRRHDRIRRILPTAGWVPQAGSANHPHTPTRTMGDRGPPGVVVKLARLYQERCEGDSCPSGSRRLCRSERRGDHRTRTLVPVHPDPRSDPPRPDNR